MDLLPKSSWSKETFILDENPTPGIVKCGDLGISAAQLRMTVVVGTCRGPFLMKIDEFGIEGVISRYCRNILIVFLVDDTQYGAKALSLGCCKSIFYVGCFMQLEVFTHVLRSLVPTALLLISAPSPIYRFENALCYCRQGGRGLPCGFITIVNGGDGLIGLGWARQNKRGRWTLADLAMLPWPVEMGWLPIAAVGRRVAGSDGGKGEKMGSLLDLRFGIHECPALAQMGSCCCSSSALEWKRKGLEKTMTPPDPLDLLWSKTREKMGDELIAVAAGDGEDVVRSRRNGTRGLAVVLSDGSDQLIGATLVVVLDGSGVGKMEIWKIMGSGSSHRRYHSDWNESVDRTPPEMLVPAAMTAGLEEDDGAPNLVLRWCTKVWCLVDPKDDGKVQNDQDCNPKG
ncbi:hypothetical protein ACLOJK_029261 [Asimina triloba]